MKVNKSVKWYYSVIGITQIMGVLPLYSADTILPVQQQSYKPTGRSFLYAPWRSTWVGKPKKRAVDCVFCDDIQYGDDRERLILARFTHCVVALNLFPYAKGHLLVLPYAHGGTLQELAPEARAELMEVITLCIDILYEAVQCEGCNVGWNLGGRVAGASISDHLHIHILPRHANEFSFIQLIGQTDVIECDMMALYDTLKPYFDTVRA